MPKERVSTTVDAQLLARARALNPGSTDASMLEQALSVLLAQHRRAEIDVAYARAYDEQPVDERDVWGNPVAFAEAAARS